MKENRLGPRQWAFVVVAGGAVCALPFASRQAGSKPEPVVDVASTLLPESQTSASVVSTSAVVASSPTASSNATSLPSWPPVAHSPFDELVQQKAVVSEARPDEEIVPMQPLRPWISAPNMSDVLTSQASSPPATLPALPPGTGKPPSRIQDVAALGSPWRESADDKLGDHELEDHELDDGANQPSRPGGLEAAPTFVQSYGQGRRQLPVTAGPADQYTAEEIAAKLNLPKQELVSAIVPADQVPSIQPVQAPHAPPPKSSVVLSRQPGARSLGAQVRFGAAQAQPFEQSGAQATGQSNGQPSYLSESAPPGSTGMVPLPKLPEERRNHVIFQPVRH